MCLWGSQHGYIISKKSLHEVIKCNDLITVGSLLKVVHYNYIYS